MDLFCGVGGLSCGLASAGLHVAAGIDIDRSCRFPFETNMSGARFVERDVCDITGEDLAGLWPPNTARLLAGCAPCQPFSSYRKNVSASNDHRWGLLTEFGRLVAETLPEFVAAENVPRLANKTVFSDFAESLQRLGYTVDYKVIRCVDYGIAQDRRRLVLVASRVGAAMVPAGRLNGRPPTTVRQAIGALPSIEAGETHEADPMHRSPNLSTINRQRIAASVPGGTWHDWPEELRLACHRRASGARFTNVYARMCWDRPAPTLSTHFHNFGAGRFGHPEQDRAVSLREAAMLQGFPENYRFVPDGEPAPLGTLGRHIGNAVPPPLGEAIGRGFLETLRSRTGR